MTIAVEVNVKMFWPSLMACDPWRMARSTSAKRVGAIMTSDLQILEFSNKQATIFYFSQLDSIFHTLRGAYHS